MKTEVVKINDVQAVTPMSLVQIAIEQNADIDKLEKLFDLQLKWEKAEAKKKFDEAMSNFHSNPPVIIKDMVNNQYNSAYVSIGALANGIGQAMAPLGLSLAWDQENGDAHVTVTCTISHVAGHEKSSTLTGGLDVSGKKNSLQQIKSTVTYLRVSTLESVTGIIASNEGADDGNSADALDYDAVVQLLESAKTLAELDTRAKQAINLGNEDKAKARAVYEKCKEALNDKA